jgi:hypothetical protein
VKKGVAILRTKRLPEACPPTAFIIHVRKGPWVIILRHGFLVCIFVGYSDYFDEGNGIFTDTLHISLDPLFHVLSSQELLKPHKNQKKELNFFCCF